MPRLASLRETAPDLDVRVMTAQGELDLAPRAGRRADRPRAGGLARLHRRPLFPEVVLPICAPGLLARPAAPADARALAALPLLHLEAGDGRRWLDWPGFLAAVGSPPPGAAAG